MKNLWYEKSYRRNLVDMHIDDSDPVYMSQFDPIKYVDNLVIARTDTAIIYAGNCLGICFWPTRIGHKHKNLKSRDILKETIVECRRGLNVIVYFTGKIIKNITSATMSLMNDISENIFIF